MTSAIGWYGPLIDLSEAGSHVRDFVQLLVLVQRSIPVQYKLSKSGGSIRTDILVGDETRSFFSVTIWHKQIGAMIVAGEVILLQNVKITKFGSFIEASTAQCSSLVRLVYPYESLISKGVDELMKDCRVGKLTVDKLRKVIIWGQRAVSVINNINHTPVRGQHLRNWKVPEQSESLNLQSLSEVSCLSSSCKAIFNACVGEIFLPITWKALGETESEKMFVSCRIGKAEDSTIVEDFICSGCQECGSPLDSDDRCMFQQNSGPFYCPKSRNHFHDMSFIYRPFMLYVWDESEYLPLLVRNKAAELLFGNLTADKVAASHRRQRHCQKPVKEVRHEENSAIAAEDLLCSPPTEADTSLDVKQMSCSGRKIDFHLIWLILLKMLLQHGRNNSLKFEITVNSGLDSENGKFELVSVSLPCIKNEQLN